MPWLVHEESLLPTSLILSCDQSSWSPQHAICYNWETMAAFHAALDSIKRILSKLVVSVTLMADVSIWTDCSGGRKHSWDKCSYWVYVLLIRTSMKALCGEVYGGRHGHICWWLTVQEWKQVERWEVWPHLLYLQYKYIGRSEEWHLLYL